MVSGRPVIAIIGSGTAGIACGLRLHGRGIQPRLFEKSRGIGGRLATRRTDTGLEFDHGAPFFTAGEGPFRRFLDTPQAAGQIAEWSPKGAGSERAKDWIVGAPRMNSPLKSACGALTIHLNTEVARIRRDGEGWALSGKGLQPDLRFDGVVVTAPAPQTDALTAISPRLHQQVSAARMAPVWALMVAFRQTLIGLADLYQPQSGPIAWLARNASKPGRPPESETWVAHADEAWSRDNLERAAESVAARLYPVVLDILGHSATEPVHMHAHRWRYAHVIKPVGTPFLEDETGTLLAAGDWCLGAGAACAFRSGEAAADRLLQRFSP